MTADVVDTAVINLGTDLNSLAQAITGEAAYGFTLGLTDQDAIIQPNAPTIYTVTTEYRHGHVYIRLQCDRAARRSDGDVQPEVDHTGAGSVDSGWHGHGHAESFRVGHRPDSRRLHDHGDRRGKAVDITLDAGPTGFFAPSRCSSAPSSPARRLLTWGERSTSPPKSRALSTSLRMLRSPRIVATDANGEVLVLASTPVIVPLTTASGLTSVDLGSFDTTAFADGADTVTVTVTDQSGRTSVSAVGQGSVTIGSPVTAVLSVSTTTLPTGTGTVTNTLQIQSSVPLSDPLTVDGQTATTPATAVALYQDAIDKLTLAYVSGPNGIDIVNVSNPDAPVDLGTFGQTDIVSGGLTVGRLDTIAAPPPDRRYNHAKLAVGRLVHAADLLADQSAEPAARQQHFGFPDVIEWHGLPDRIPQRHGRGGEHGAGADLGVLFFRDRFSSPGGQYAGH